jgi:hypothetical protein
VDERGCKDPGTLLLPLFRFHLKHHQIYPLKQRLNKKTLKQNRFYPNHTYKQNRRYFEDLILSIASHFNCKRQQTEQSIEILSSIEAHSTRSARDFALKDAISDNIPELYIFCSVETMEEAWISLQNTDSAGEVNGGPSTTLITL